MDSKGVSIVIPTYNSAAFVRRAIGSALAQHVKPNEIIIVDNNSTDDTWEILQDYATRYPDMIKVFREKRQGGNYARNLGLEKSKGEWIQFLDADDELLPQKISTQLDLAANPDFRGGFIVGSYTRVRLSDKLEPVKPYDFDYWQALIHIRLGITSANLFRRQALLQAGGWNVDLKANQEYELMFRLLKSGPPPIFCHEAHALVHEQEGSVTGQANKLRNRRGAVELLMDIGDYLYANKLLDAARSRRLMNNTLDKIKRVYRSDAATGKLLFENLKQAPWVNARVLFPGDLYNYGVMLLGLTTLESVRKIFR